MHEPSQTKLAEDPIVLTSGATRSDATAQVVPIVVEWQIVTSRTEDQGRSAPPEAQA